MRTCIRCGTRYRPTSNRQKYCIKCGSIVHKEQTAEWCDTHPEERKAGGRKCYQLHREKRIAAVAAYRLANLEKVAGGIQSWKIANPDKMQIMWEKQNAKRRTLGFVPLNSPFGGCERHHINTNDVIYIPKTMHRSIPHNVWTGRNMEKINALAGAYLTEDWT